MEEKICRIWTSVFSDAIHAVMSNQAVVRIFPEPVIDFHIYLPHIEACGIMLWVVVYPDSRYMEFASVPADGAVAEER